MIIGSVMYTIEGSSGNPGFTSIPQSIYWGIVTLTTVGYGDITPQTDLGRFLAAALMIIGYAIIAVPTGIVTTELVKGQPTEMSGVSCKHCGAEGHRPEAKHCYRCGAELND
jgi:voltage-gated potassium channel